MDIAREYLHKLPEEILDGNEKVKTLEEIIKKGFQYPLVPLRNLITPKYEKIKKDDYNGDLDIVDKISFSDGKIHIRKQRQTGMDLYIAEKEELITSKINLHQGAIAVNNIGRLACSTHYQVYHIDRTEVIPEYLAIVMRSSLFLQQVAAEKNKGIKNEAGYEFISNFLIPLPLLEIQREIVEKIEKQKAVMDGARRIEESWEINYTQEVFSYPKSSIGFHIRESLYGSSQKAEYQDDGYPIIRINNIGFCDFDFSDLKRVVITENDFKKYHLKDNDFLIVRSNGNPDLVGKCAVWKGQVKNCVYASYLIRFRFNDDIDPKYIMFYFMSRSGKQQLTPKQGGGTYNINAEEFKSVEIPLPPLPIQKEIVAKLDKEMEALEGVRLLRQEAVKRIERIIEEVWGEG